MENIVRNLDLRANKEDGSDDPPDYRDLDPAGIRSRDAHMLGCLIDRMCCPKCGAGLQQIDQVVLCTGCGVTFPIVDGIAMLALRGAADTWTDERSSKTSSEYQRAYEELEAAAGYDAAYRERPFKRSTTIREKSLLGRLLSGQGMSATMLNLPSGGGRLSNIFSEHTDILIEADIALGQLRFARKRNERLENAIWLNASAFHVPFKDESIDAVICCRLCHHLPSSVERERLLSESLRVARRFVIFSFFDYHSPKNFLRRARRPFNGKPPKLTMTRERLSELARAHNARLVDAPALAYLFSGHRYALMQKLNAQEKSP